MSLWFRDLLLVSRPRFWLYTLWPVIIAWIAWFSQQYDWFNNIRAWVVAVYNDASMLWYTLFVFFCFLIPANSIIYWVNDICDFETDFINKKKWTYELKINKNKLHDILLYVVINSLFFVFLWYYTYILWLLPSTSIFWIICWFLFFSVFYSAEPIRAKAIPFLDGMFNVLYLFGIPFWRIIAWQQIDTIHTFILISALFFMMAWHAFSAIPDIVPDANTWITTTAVFLWEKYTLIYCCILRFIASVLLYPFLWLRILPLLIIFCWLCITSFYIPIFTVYKVIPYIIPFIGTFYFWVILLRW